MDAKQMVRILFSCVGLGIVVGGVLGLAIGALSPGLIEMFLGEHARSPLGDGLALGILNGGIYGFFGGIAVLFGAVILARRKTE